MRFFPASHIQELLIVVEVLLALVSAFGGKRVEFEGEISDCDRLVFADVAGPKVETNDQ